MFGSFEITSIRLYTPLILGYTPLCNTLCGLLGVYNLIEVISSWTKQKLRSILNNVPQPSKLLLCYTVDSRYLEFDGTMEKIWVNRSSTREELRKYRKCSLFNDERETTWAKFWRAKTSIACPYSQNDFKHMFLLLFFSLC